MPRLRSAVSVGVVAMLLVSCGSPVDPADVTSGSAGSAVSEPDDAAATEATTTQVGLSPGETGLVLAVGTGSSDARVGNLTLHTDHRAIVLLATDGEHAATLDSSSSADYASSTVRLMRSGDRVFSLRKWDGGSLDAVEYDLASATQRGTVTTWDDASQWSTVVIDDTLYYRTESQGGSDGGTYLALPISSTSTRGQEITGAEVPWGIRTDGDQLYSMTKDGARIVLETFDPATGRSTGVVGDFTAQQDEQFEAGSWRFAVDDGVVFWTTLHPATGTVALWSYRPGQELPVPVAESASAGLASILAVDCDDGRFVVLARTASSQEVLLLYDETTQAWQQLDLDLSIHDAVIVHLD